MTGIEPGSSGIGSERVVNCATTNGPCPSHLPEEALHLLILKRRMFTPVKK